VKFNKEIGTKKTSGYDLFAGDEKKKELIDSFA